MGIHQIRNWADWRHHDGEPYRLYAATTIPAEREEMPGRFYRENPNHLTTFQQADSITGWYAFSGQNGLRITDFIIDHLQNVVGKRAEADATLQRMAADVQALLPLRS
jgi:multiple sugar transport system substrate-binding protein